MKEEYVPSPEIRKKWCQGQVGRPHQFEFWRYCPKQEGYPDNQPIFIFHCVACGRKRRCLDAEGMVEESGVDDLSEEIPEPKPIGFVLRVYVDAIAEDGTHRRICDHSETRSARRMSDSDLEVLRTSLIVNCQVSQGYER